MKPRHKLTTEQQQQTEQTGQLNTAKNSALEFKTAEELLRHDAAQVSVPPAVAVRLHQSTGDLPPPPQKLVATFIPLIHERVTTDFGIGDSGDSVVARFLDRGLSAALHVLREPDGLDLPGCSTRPGLAPGQLLLIPNNLLDFVLSGFALAILGGALERKWSARTLLCYSFTVIVLTGLSWTVIPFAGSGPWHGAAPLFFALLAAWGRTCGGQAIYLAPAVQMKAITAAMLFGGISILSMALTMGWMSALFAALGAVWGLGYLWVRSRQGEAAARPIAVSQRINRLEL